MPLDLTTPVIPQDQIPDTGDVRDLSPGAFPEVSYIPDGSNLELPEVPVTPTSLGSSNFTSPPDYSVLEGLVSGWQDTSISAMWNAYDEPDFDYDPDFKSEEALRYYQKSHYMSFSDEEASKLLNTGSMEEFEHQIMRFDEHKQAGAVASQNPLTYLAGSIVDVDSLVPYGLGKISRVAKLAKIQRAAVVGGATGAVSYGAYEADNYTALSTADIAFQVSVMTAAGLIPELFKTAKVTNAGTVDIDAKLNDFNPSGVLDDSDDGSSLLERGDLTDPTSTAKTILVDDINGVTYLKDGDDYLAIQGGDTVGELSIVDGEVFVTVLPEMRGKGVGKELFKSFFSLDATGAKAGSFTPAGRAAAKAALEELHKQR